MISNHEPLQINNYFILIATHARPDEMSSVVSFLENIAQKVNKYRWRLLCTNTADELSFGRALTLISQIEAVADIRTQGVLLYKRPQPDLDQAYNALRIAGKLECDGFTGHPLLTISNVPLAQFFEPIMEYLDFTGVKGKGEMKGLLTQALAQNPRIIIYDADAQVFV